VVDQPHGQAAGGQPDLLVAVAVDHVVLARLAGPAGLAPPLLAAGLPLELEGAVLGDMPQPGALAQPLHEPAPAADPAGVVDQPGEQGEQVVGERRDRVRGEGLQRPEVDQQVDGLVVRPVVGPAVDPGLQDLEIRPGAEVGLRARGRLGAVDSRSRPILLAATLPAGGPSIGG